MSSELQNKQLQERITLLEGQVENAQRLVELESQELALAQQQAAEAQAQASQAQQQATEAQRQAAQAQEQITQVQQDVIGPLPDVQRLAGGYASSLHEDGSMDVELQAVVGSTNQLGFGRLTCLGI